MSSFLNRIDEFLDSNKLNEIGTVCRLADGYGMIIVVYSDDHAPAHAHILNKDRKEIGKFEITKNKPNTINDIIEVQCEIPIEFKKKIFKWSQSKTRFNISTWKNLQIAWDLLHD